MCLLILWSLLWDGHRPFHFTDEQRDSQAGEACVHFHSWVGMPDSKARNISTLTPRLIKLNTITNNTRTTATTVFPGYQLKSMEDLKDAAWGDRSTPAHKSSFMKTNSANVAPSLPPAWRSPPLLELQGTRLHSFQRELLLRERRQWKDLGQSHWQLLPNALMFSTPIYGKLKWRYHSRLADVRSPEQEHPWSCIRAGLG